MEDQINESYSIHDATEGLVVKNKDGWPVGVTADGVAVSKIILALETKQAVEALLNALNAFIPLSNEVANQIDTLLTVKRTPVVKSKATKLANAVRYNSRYIRDLIGKLTVEYEDSKERGDKK